MSSSPILTSSLPSRQTPGNFKCHYQLLIPIIGRVDKFGKAGQSRSWSQDPRYLVVDVIPQSRSRHLPLTVKPSRAAARRLRP